MRASLDHLYRVELISEAVSLRAAHPVVNGKPLEDWQAQVAWQAEPATEMVFCFNAHDRPVQRTYPLSALGLAGPKYLFEWVSNETTVEPVQSLNLLLPPHDGRLFFLSSQPWSPTLGSGQ